MLKFINRDNKFRQIISSVEDFHRKETNSDIGITSRNNQLEGMIPES